MLTNLHFLICSVLKDEGDIYYLDKKEFLQEFSSFKEERVKHSLFTESRFKIKAFKSFFLGVTRGAIPGGGLPFFCLNSDDPPSAAYLVSLSSSQEDFFFS